MRVCTWYVSSGVSLIVGNADQFRSLVNHFEIYKCTIRRKTIYSLKFKDLALKTAGDVVFFSRDYPVHRGIGNLLGLGRWAGGSYLPREDAR